jgi:hypothetical protein
MPGESFLHRPLVRAGYHLPLLTNIDLQYRPLQRPVPNLEQLIPSGRSHQIEDSAGKRPGSTRPYDALEAWRKHPRQPQSHQGQHTRPAPSAGGWWFRAVRLRII